MLNQKQGVYSAVRVVMEKNGEDIPADKPVNLSPEQKQQVITLVVRGIQEGEIEMKEESKKKHEGHLSKSYVNGLVNNWLRKDTRLNGGKPYQPRTRRLTEPSELDHGTMQRLFSKTLGKDASRSTVKSATTQKSSKNEAETSVQVKTGDEESVSIDLAKLPKEIREAVLRLAH